MIFQKFRILLVSVLLLSSVSIFSQTHIYTVSSGELLFQWSDVSFTDDYMQQHPNDELVGNPLRFTMFLHLGQYVHIDFNNNFGILSGLALRNVGFISDERLDFNDDGNIQDFKIIRRSYTLGLPLAIKLGSFKNHTYLFGGGEYELAFAYKEKYWNSHNRSGSKSPKFTQWFGSQTPTFIPSVFAGVQFPGGVNIKFKYYLENFINNKYTNPNNRISDLTRYKNVNVMYISLSWQFNTGDLIKHNQSKSNSNSNI